MGWFELLRPNGLWLLTGAAPLVLLYVLKIKRQRQRVSSTFLWAAAQRDLLAKHPFRKLVAEVPLVLQLAALALLALALSRPAMRGAGILGDHVAIVIDTSASMGTAAGSPGDVGKTRMDAAKEAARAVIAGLSVGADGIVFEAGREPRAASPLERDVRHLRAAVDQVSAHDVEGDLAPAVAMAADRLRGLSGKRRVVVITDGALAHDSPLTAAGADLQVIVVGDARDNAAIVRVDVRAGIDPTTHAQEAQAFALVRNYADAPRDVYVTLSLEGSADPLASRRVLLPPHERVPVVLTFEPSPLDAGKGLVFELSPHDALAVDDVAFGRVPGGRRMPVVLASRAPFSWTARALGADPDLDLQRVTLEQLATVNADPDALVVVEGACPEAPPGHDLMVIAPPVGRCSGLDVGPEVQQPQITSWDASDPRMRFLTLDGVHIARALALSTPGIGVGLVRAGTTTLIADASIPGRTVSILGFDPGDSDWPLKASFVLFVRNVVEVARQHRAAGATAAVVTGEPLRVVVPPGVASIRVDGPAMPDHEVTAKGGFAIVAAIERAGLYHVRWTAPHVGGAVVAANLASEAESDVRAKPVAYDADGAHATAAGGVSVGMHQEYGVWLAVLAALVVALDIVWMTRRAKTNGLRVAAPVRPLRGAR